MADADFIGFCSPPGSLQTAFKGQFYGFAGDYIAEDLNYLIGRQADSVVPTLQSMTSRDDEVQLVFDYAVDMGSPSFPAPESVEDPTFTGTTQVSDVRIDVAWTLYTPPTPTVTSVASKDAGVEVAFDNPILVGTPTYPAPESARDPLFASMTQVGANTIRANWTIPTATVTSVASKDAGVQLDFDIPVLVGTPSYPAPESARDPLFASMTQVDVDSIRANWTIPTPTISTIYAKIAGMEVTFDIPVNDGTPTITPAEDPTDPTVTGTTQTTSTKVTVDWTLPATPVPTITNVASLDAGLEVTFDLDVLAGTPTIPAPESASDPTIDSVTQTASDIVTFDWTLPVTGSTVTNVYSSDSGLVVTFDNSVFAGTPTIDPPESAIDPVVSGTTQTDPVTLTFDWTIYSGINLVSVTSNPNEVVLTFDAPIGLNLVGQDPANYSITTVTVGAVEPAVTAVNTSGADLVITTDPQTIGASYVLHLPALSVYNLGDGSTWPLNTAAFTGDDISPYAVAAYPTSSRSFIVQFNEPVTEATATDPDNYGIAPALTISSIDYIDSTTVKVYTTGDQMPGVTYTVTITGVLDRANNPT